MFRRKILHQSFVDVYFQPKPFLSYLPFEYFDTFFFEETAHKAIKLQVYLNKCACMAGSKKFLTNGFRGRSKSHSAVVLKACIHHDLWCQRNVRDVVSTNTKYELEQMLSVI